MNLLINWSVWRFIAKDYQEVVSFCVKKWSLNYKYQNSRKRTWALLCYFNFLLTPIFVLTYYATSVDLFATKSNYSIIHCIFISWPQAVDNGLLLCHLKTVFSFCTLVIIPVCGMFARLCCRVFINFLKYAIMLSLNHQLRQFAPHTFPKKIWKILFGTNLVNDEFGGKKGWIWYQWTQFSLVTLRLVFVVLETLIEYTLGMYNAPKIRKKTRCHVTRLDSVNLLMCSCSTSLHFFSYWKEDGKPTIATPNGFPALTLNRICQA